MATRNDAHIAEPAGLIHAASRCGRLSVTATAAGLPVGLRIDPSMLTCAPDVLAGHITALCELAALSAGAAHRAELESEPDRSALISALKLPTAEAVAAAEDRLDRRLRGGLRGGRSAR